MTNEDNAQPNNPFGPSFQPNPPGVFDVQQTNGGGEKAPAPKRRGRPRKAHPQMMRAGQQAPVKKPRAAPAVTRAGAIARQRAKAGKIDIALAVQALSGLTPEDARFVVGVESAMRAFSPKQRQRIAAAIGKLFA